MKNYPKNIDLSKIDLSVLKNIDFKPQTYWPEIFDTMDLSNRSDPHLCADGLMAWANCSAGFDIHPNFGKVMDMIGKRLNIFPTGENLEKWSKKWLEETRVAKHESEQV